MSEIYDRHLSLQSIALSGLMSGTDSESERADIIAAYKDALAAFEIAASQVQVANDDQTAVSAPQAKKKKAVTPPSDAPNVVPEQPDRAAAT